jgi:pimeloyl-ACP methyl ester carboxylesterase
MTYAPVNGLQLYYEVRGSGRPLVLLHGGLLTIDLNFGPLLEPLAASRRLIAVELQGHGHTADTGRPMTIEALAGATVRKFLIGAQGITLDSPTRAPGTHTRRQRDSERSLPLANAPQRQLAAICSKEPRH